MTVRRGQRLAWGAVVGVMLTAALGGCTGQAATRSHDYSGALYQSQVDPKTGDIVFPLDRFILNDEEIQTLDDAQEIARVECENAHGYQSKARMDIPEIGGSSFFGVWVLANAEKFAYTPPTSPAKAAALVRNSQAPDVTDAQQKIGEDCANSPAVERFDPPGQVSPGGLGEATEKLSGELYADERAKAVIAAWSDCLEAHGLRRDTSEGTLGVQGADYNHITEASIKIAVQDVKCKTQVNLVPTLAKVEASYEDPIVEKYLPELQANRAKIDAKLADARAYLAANGGTIPGGQPTASAADSDDKGAGTGD